MTATQKIRALTENSEDYEWYPTTDEILSAMNKDLHTLFMKEKIAEHSYHNRHDKMFSYESGKFNDKKGEYEKTYFIKTFLDVGAGDGRVFDAVNGRVAIERRYGIEKSKAQADDLIGRGVFIIGRDFFKTSLLDKEYGVIFSNPPYSRFAEWTEKLFREANFGVMYLVLPVRWQHQTREAGLRVDKRCGIELYDVKVIGEFDFLHADRSARARVNLIRVTHKKVKVEDHYRGESAGHHFEFGCETERDSFERWIAENIGSFEAEPGENEKEKDLKLKESPIPELVESFEAEAKALFDLFKAIGKTPFRVIEAFHIDRKSVLEVIRENIKSLKERYWRIAFDKLSVINSRLIHETRRKLLYEMEEFQSLDFNEDNIYTIAVWVIKHFNEYTGEQILSVFDALTSQDYITAYKSNVHWNHDDWRYGRKPKPEKYKLDYRLVTHCYKSYRYDQCVVDDFIVICRSLGYYIPDYRYLDHEALGAEQRFCTVENQLAFTVRLYKNHNAHLKINQDLMMKFNIEVARLRHWINDHRDIQEEFEVSEAEALRLWNQPSLLNIGQADIPLLEYKKSA